MSFCSSDLQHFIVSHGYAPCCFSLPSQGQPQADCLKKNKKTHKKTVLLLCRWNVLQRDNPADSFLPVWVRMNRPLDQGWATLSEEKAVNDGSLCSWFWVLKYWFRHKFKNSSSILLLTSPLFESQFPLPWTQKLVQEVKEMIHAQCLAYGLIHAEGSVNVIYYCCCFGFFWCF